MSKPQITEIAQVLATKLTPEAGDDSAQAWRTALHYANKAGVMGELTDQLSRDAANDDEVQAQVEALRR